MRRQPLTGGKPHLPLRLTDSALPRAPDGLEGLGLGAHRPEYLGVWPRCPTDFCLAHIHQGPISGPTKAVRRHSYHGGGFPAPPHAHQTRLMDTGKGGVQVEPIVLYAGRLRPSDGDLSAPPHLFPHICPRHSCPARSLRLLTCIPVSQ